MLDDRELCEQLKNIYETTGIDLLGTEKEDNSSPERVEDKVVTRYEPKLCREMFEIGYGKMQVSVDYSNKCIAVQNGAEVLRMPFYAIPSLMHFLGWLIDSRKIDKE